MSSALQDSTAVESVATAAAAAAAAFELSALQPTPAKVAKVTAPKPVKLTASTLITSSASNEQTSTGFEAEVAAPIRRSQRVSQPVLKIVTKSAAAAVALV